MPEVHEQTSGQETLDHPEGRDAKSESFTLTEAVQMFSDPSLLQEFEKHREQGGILAILAQNHPGPIAGVDEETFPIIRSQRELAEDQLDKLRRGELLARGYDSRWRLESGPVDIPPNAWDFLRQDFRDSSASGGGLRFAGVRVRKACLNPPAEPAAAPVRPTRKAMLLCRSTIDEMLKGDYPYVNRKSLLRDLRMAIESNNPGVRITTYTLKCALVGVSMPESWRKRGPKARK